MMMVVGGGARIRLSLLILLDYASERLKKNSYFNQMVAANILRECAGFLRGGWQIHDFSGFPELGRRSCRSCWLAAAGAAAAAPGLKEGEKGHHWRACSAKMWTSPARSEVRVRGRPR